MKQIKSDRRLNKISALALAVVMAVGMCPLPATASGDTYTVNVSSVNIRSSASTDAKVITRASRGENVEVLGTSGDWYKVKYSGETGYIRKDMLVEGKTATSSSSKPTATVTGSSVNIRKSASTGAAILKRVEKGAVLEAVSISDGWVKVKYSGETGYVSADYVKVSGLSYSSGSSATLKEMDENGTVNASSVNVRDGASTSSDKLYSLSKGASVDVTGIKGDWYRVHTSKGTGYVLSKYVTIVVSSNSSSGSDSTGESLKEMSAKGTITGGGVNVRKSASTSSTALYKLSSGDSVSVTGKQGDWYRVKTGEGTGFVLGKYVSVDSSSSSSSSDYTVKDADGLAVITGSTVNVRKTPSKDAAMLYQLDKGNEVTITGTSGDWYRIKTSKGEGFVKSDFLDLTVVVSNSLKEGMKDSTDVKSMQKRLIELGYMSGTADGDFGTTTKNALIAFQKNAGLTADGIAGATTLKALNSSSAPKASSTAKATTAPTATATAAATTYTTLKQGSNGESVKKLQKRLIELGYLSGSADGDYGSATTDAVKAFQKQTGITADGIAGAATQKAVYSSSAASKKTEADEIEDKLDSIKSTLSMGSSGSSVKTLQQRLINLGYLSGSADGNFGAKTRDAVMLFQKQAGLTVDGKAGKTTLSKLSSSSAAKYDGKTTISSSSSSSSSSSNTSSGSSSTSKSGVILADWWTSSIQSVYSRGTIATVTDVKTGISWKVKRRGGTNHADTEPLTAEDTAKMKKAYGGTWSWTRHAIWVTVGGKTYAASMNGMPHATYSITDNNFPGHFCIHFLNSRTHTGNRLDSAHQSCVKTAYNAGN